MRSRRIGSHTFRRPSVHVAAERIAIRVLVLVHPAIKLLPALHSLRLQAARNAVDVREIIADKQPAAVRLVVQRQDVDAATGVLRFEDEGEGELVADLGRLVPDEGADQATRVDGELGEAAGGGAAADADEVREVDLVDVARGLVVEAPDEVGVEAADGVLEHSQHEVALVRFVAVVDEVRAAHQQPHGGAAVRRGLGEVAAADAVDAANGEGEASNHVVAIDCGK